MAVNSDGDIFVVGDIAASGGVLRSTDNGVSWTSLTNGIDADNFITIAITDSCCIFIGSRTDDIIYRSLDNGDSWMPVLITDPPVGIETIAINPSNTIFAGTESNVVYRSIDNGDTWQAFSMEIIDPHPYITDIVFDGNNNIYASSYVDGVF